MQLRADAVERAAVQRDQRDVGQRPAEPRRRQAEGRRRRHHQRLVGRDMVRAAPSRRHGGTDRPRRARRPAARARQHRRRPPRENGLGQGSRLAADQRRRQRQVPRARRTRSRRSRPGRARQALRPSTPSSPMPTMDSQRLGEAGSRMTGSARHHAHPHPRRHRRGAGARRRLGRPPRPRRDPVARRPHRRPRAASPCRSDAAASAAPRARRAIFATSSIDALIDATHPYAADHLRQRRAAPPRTAQCRCSRCGAPPWTQRTPATTGSRSTRSRPRSRHSATAPRRVFPRPRPQGACALRRRAAARLSRAQRRSASIRRSRRAARRLHHRARTVHRGGRPRAARTRTASRLSSPRTAAATPPTARSPRRARSACRSSC